MIKAEYKDKSLVVDILCKSFDSNQSVNYIIKQDSRRIQRIINLMSYSFEICYLFGTVYLSEDKKGCALVLFPDKKKITLRSVFLDFRIIISCLGVFNVKKATDRKSKIEKFYSEKQIFYLWFIGVNPDDQDKGIGSRLLRDIIAESISIRRTIYLETSITKNLDFYKRMGFEVYQELDFGHKLYLIKGNFNSL